MHRTKTLGLELLELRQLLAADGADLARDRFDIHQNASAQLLDVLANDRFDEDYAGSQRITNVSLGSLGGRVSVGQDGRSVSYTPPADQSGKETFTYFVDGSHSASVSISIVAPLKNDAVSLIPDQRRYTLDVLGNDPFWQDYDGAGKITLVSASAIGAGVAISADGKTLVYDRLEHRYGRDSLTYVVDDKYPATVTIDIKTPLQSDQFQIVQFAPAETIPVLRNDPLWTGYEGARRITHVLDVPEGAAAEIVDDGASIRFSPNDVAAGAYSMRYVVDGSYEATLTAYVVRPVTDDFFWLDKDSQRFSVNLLDNDNFRSIDDSRRVIDVIDRITSVSPSEHGAEITISPDGQGVLYSPPRGFVGTDSFSYLADGIHEAVVSVTVREPAEVQYQRDDYFTVYQGTQQNTLDVLANDFKGDGYQGSRLITGIGNETDAEIQIAADGKSLYFTPNDEQANYQFTYEVDASLTVSVWVNVRNIAISDSYWFDQPQSETLRIVDRIEFPKTYVGDRLITAVDQPENGGRVEISADGRSLLYEPGVGATSFQYTLDGKYVGSIFVGYHQRLNWDSYVVYQNSDARILDVLANDFDDASEQRWGRYVGKRAITHVESLTGNSVVAISADGRSIQFQPQTDFVGTEQLRYVVDGFLEASVSVDVARLLRHDRLHVDPGSVAVLDVLQNDLVGGDYPGALEITSVDGGSAGATIKVADDGKSLVYEAAEGFTGRDVFEYTVDHRLKAEVVVEVNASRGELYGKLTSLAAFQQLVLENLALQEQGWIPGEDGGWIDDALAPSVARDHSETNVQVAGVDEADLIETDSDHLYTLTDGQLVITQAWPADELRVLSRRDIPGVAIGMYLDGDRLAVVSEEQNFVIWDDVLFPIGIGRTDAFWYPQRDPVTYVTIFDVTDRTDPRLVQRTEFEGQHVQTRRIEDHVYVVLRDEQSVVPDWEQICEGDGEDAVCRYETVEERRQRVQDDFPAVVEDLLPNYESYGADGTLVRAGLLIQPEDIFDPLSEGAASLVSVAAININSDEPGLASTTGVLTTGASQLYMTTHSLYVFEEQYGWSTEALQDNPSTNILKFDLGDAGGVAFVSSGQVPGRMLNQFSADENDGFLRIATTISNWGTGNYSRKQENALFVLRDDVGVLEYVGGIQNLALNETIQSVRFFEDHAMVTTFQSIDPLYSINLSDPQAPYVEGFLTLPGFASYMQFVDAEHLLTIGRSTAAGWGGTVAISLFDVSNILQPVLIDQFNWESFAHSPAATDHHAFGWFANHGTLTIPSQRNYTIRVDADGDGYREREELVTEHSLHAFGIDASLSTRDEAGIVLNGTVTVESPLLRSAYIDDTLYAIASKSIVAAAIQDPSQIFGVVDIGRAEDDVEEPVVDARLPVISQLQLDARRQLATAVGVRPEEVLLVSTEAEADRTQLMLRVDNDYFVYGAVGDQLDSEAITHDYQGDDWQQPLVWHNESSPLDTDGNGYITARDALVAINAINGGRAGALPKANVVNQIEPISATYKIDTNGDGYLSPIDVLLIIRHINAQNDVHQAAADAVFASAWFQGTRKDQAS